MLARALRNHDETPAEDYVEATASNALPGLDLSQFTSYLDRDTASQAIRECRAALSAAP